ncbi:hypothetical protein JAAARDRAFT_75790 [Jaapia argillacea MUCL 33604]|uniref:Homeobox domain-containing protein n=1 Tax=Jaapia argillacea MUCL 33604 TaxID=933084 RepID=A0A067Q8K5_9AGAM|nr:hypothetical protein JAAARDRAFT_75790 [Jaapia argillacea MUCL 33604]
MALTHNSTPGSLTMNFMPLSPTASRAIRAPHPLLENATASSVSSTLSFAHPRLSGPKPLQRSRTSFVRIQLDNLTLSSPTSSLPTPPSTPTYPCTPSPSRKAMMLPPKQTSKSPFVKAAQTKGGPTPKTREARLKQALESRIKASKARAEKAASGGFKCWQIATLKFIYECITPYPDDIWIYHIAQFLHRDTNKVKSWFHTRRTSQILSDPENWLPLPTPSVPFCTTLRPSPSLTADLVRIPCHGRTLMVRRCVVEIIPGDGWSDVGFVDQVRLFMEGRKDGEDCVMEEP